MVRFVSDYRRTLACLLAGLIVLAGYGFLASGGQGKSSVERVPELDEHLAKATFAGGCFWCMEPPFEKLDGVEEAVSGFTGGEVENPAYKDVASGKTNHREAVQVYYDPSKVSYEQLLEVFWRQVDPTDDEGQFVDRGFQYTTAVFVHDDQQRMLAESSKEQLSDAGIFDGPIKTPVLDASKFYRASDYHQDYYKTHSIRYNYYRANSGRDDYLESTWDGHGDFQIFTASEKQPEPETSEFRESSGSTSDQANRSYDIPSQEQLKKQLTDRQYRITQEDGTEPAYDNKYWDNKKPGIYVDVVSGEPLFSSTHKYTSGTGWPSFYKALEPDNIVTRTDDSLFMSRTEVRSKHADSHLGHVFDDGPDPTGLRYCINSAALEFIPADRLEEEGYGQYRTLFAGAASK